jgi:hypothetical protein
MDCDNVVRTRWGLPGPRVELAPLSGILGLGSEWDRGPGRQLGIVRSFRRSKESCFVVLRHEVEAGADHEADADLLGGDVRPHHAGERIAIGQRERGEAELGGAQHQLFGMRAAAQEREVAGDLQLGVGGHGARRHAGVRLRARA